MAFWSQWIIMHPVIVPMIRSATNGCISKWLQRTLMNLLRQKLHNSSSKGAMLSAKSRRVLAYEDYSEDGVVDQLAISNQTTLCGLVENPLLMMFTPMVGLSFEHLGSLSMFGTFILPGPLGIVVLLFVVDFGWFRLLFADFAT